tara:strand:- start:462 stop:935 length:474 start_codon:yes stop_codon:yes gene_type:complete
MFKTTHRLKSAATATLAAGMLAGGLIATGGARAAETFDATCDIDPDQHQPNPLIITGFATGSTDVPEDREVDILGYAKNLGGYSKICVVGQADKRGPAALNDKLAMDRARAVAARLIGAGIEPQTLTLSSRAEAYGDVAPDWLWFGGSRRVEIIAMY